MSKLSTSRRGEGKQIDLTAYRDVLNSGKGQTYKKYQHLTIFYLYKNGTRVMITYES